MRKNLRRLEVLEARAGINALSSMSDAEIECEMARIDALLGDDAPPPDLTLTGRIAWLERQLETVH